MNVAVAYETPTAPPAAPEAFNAYLLNVDFESSEGERWSAVGGGETVAEALAAARGFLPDGVRWAIAGWNHLYGE